MGISWRAGTIFFHRLLIIQMRAVARGLALSVRCSCLSVFLFVCLFVFVLFFVVVVFFLGGGGRTGGHWPCLLVEHNVSLSV